MSAGQPAAEIDAFVDNLNRLGGVASATEALVATPESTLYRRSAGFQVGGEPLVHGRRFDAASLTKPWMATLALVLDARGILLLGTRLGDIFETREFEREARTGGVSLLDLLRHDSGIAAWSPLAWELRGAVGDRSALVRLLLSESLWVHRNENLTEQGPALYSDLGYILWGLAVERALSRSLGDFLDELVCAPLGIAPLGALTSEPPDAVECRLDNGREVELASDLGLSLSLQRSFFLGRAQDGNARMLGFLTAHAGLFVTADEMLALAREWLRPGKLLVASARDRALTGSGSYALGWARWSEDGSSGPALSKTSFGHTGFTGGSLWIDPGTERIHLLLAHRLSSRLDFNPFRREFHRLAAAFAGPPHAGTTTAL